jgi:hypothetical protein
MADAEPKRRKIAAMLAVFSIYPLFVGKKHSAK